MSSDVTNNSFDNSTSSSSIGLSCPELQLHYEWTLSHPVLFFTFYSVVALVAIVGNSAILVITRRRPDVIQRRTYRLLTQTMSACELLLAGDLAALLFRMGVGFWNRTGCDCAGEPHQRRMLVSEAWSSEDENPFYRRGVTMRKLVLSVRDVSVGCEVFVYGLLALDRVLAIASPLSTVWSPKLVGIIVASGFISMATTEAILQAWLLAAVSAADQVNDEDTVCDLLVRVASNSLIAKSGVMVCFYLLSLTAYLATACLLVRLRLNLRRRLIVVQPEKIRQLPREQQQQQQQQQQLGKPMAALILGNLLHFVSILPLAVHSSGLARVDWISFYAFFCNCAVIPCLAIAFNASMRMQLWRVLTTAKCRRI